MLAGDIQRQVTFGRSLRKFIFTSRGGTAACERCASEEFLFHQSLSLCLSVSSDLVVSFLQPQTVWAGFGLSRVSSFHPRL